MKAALGIALTPSPVGAPEYRITNDAAEPATPVFP